MSPNEKIIDKLRKLKAHAESAAKIGSQAEAEAFAAMFQRLLLEHQLQATDLELEAEAKDEPIVHKPINWADHKTKSEPIPTGRRTQWVEKLAWVVCKAHFCRFLVTPGSARITIVGQRHHAEVAEYVLVTLVRTAVRLVNKEYASFKSANPGADGRGFNVSFLQGFIGRLRERFDEQKRQATTSTSTALMRISQADAAVVAYMAEKYKTKAGATQSSELQFNSAARQLGRERANSVNISGNAVRPGDAPSKQLR